MSSSNQPRTVQPADFGGFGKDFTGKWKETRGGLIGKAFTASAPPDISPQTRILAICGIPDDEDDTSPQSDGWFFSDFFLFHHLFKGVVDNQKWLTCVDPTYLVRRWKEFAHGDPRVERRIVLEASMLPQVSDVTVVPARDLLRTFLAEIKEEARLAEIEDRPLLIMIFAHGHEETKGIYLGTSDPKEEQYMLQMEDVAHVLEPAVQATILTTSCYGGAWAMSPLLNTTSMIAATDTTESLCWPISASCTRMCGGRFATAITNLLIQYNIPDILPSCDVPHPSDIRGRQGWKPGRSEEALQSTNSYAALLESVRSILDQIDSRPLNGITFSAQNDDWERNWSRRTGFALADFETKWKQLRLIPVGNYWASADSPSSTQSQGHSMTGSLSLRLGRRDFTTKQAQNILKIMAHNYFHSNPGNHSAANNVALASNCQSILKNRTPTQSPGHIYAQLNYRLNKIMGLATAIKDALGLNYPDCSEIDIDKYRNELDRSRNLRASSLHELILGFRIFLYPEKDEGKPYAKGNFYLALALEASGLSENEAYEKLRMVNFSKLNGTYQTMQSFELGKFSSIRTALYNLGKETRSRIRSLSPRKRKPLPDFSTWGGSGGSGTGGSGTGGSGTGGSGASGSGYGGSGARGIGTGGNG